MPNDLRVLNAAGARTATYRNIVEVYYQAYYAPIAEVALANSARAKLQFADVLDEILMVRLFDSLGPQFVTGTTRPIADALQAKAGVSGQIRSMLLSLWAIAILSSTATSNRGTAQQYTRRFWFRRSIAFAEVSTVHGVKHRPTY